MLLQYIYILFFYNIILSTIYFLLDGFLYNNNNIYLCTWGVTNVFLFKIFVFSSLKYIIFWLKKKKKKPYP